MEENEIPKTGKIHFDIVRDEKNVHMEMTAIDVSDRDFARALELIMEKLSESKNSNVGGMMIDLNDPNAEDKLRDGLEKSPLNKGERDKIAKLLLDKILRQRKNSFDEPCMCPACQLERKMKIKNDPSIN